MNGLIPTDADGRDAGIRPAIRVATAYTASSAVAGLDRPVALRGGGAALLPSGAAMAVGMAHRPDFVRAVAHSCRAQAEAGRDWYAHGCIAMIGPEGSGRGHAARRLAAATGLPLLVADASTAFGRSLLRGDAPLGLHGFLPAAAAAVAATGCGNPLILVEGLREDEDAEALLGPFVDPDRSPRFRSSALGATLDLSQVNWLVQMGAADVHRLPDGWASVVRFDSPVGDDRRLLELSIVETVRDELGGPARIDASAATAVALADRYRPCTIVDAVHEFGSLMTRIRPSATPQEADGRARAAPARIEASGDRDGTGSRPEPATGVGDDPHHAACLHGERTRDGTVPPAAPSRATPTIVVNGREHGHAGGSVCHSDLVALAYPALTEREGRAVAATWSGGPPGNVRGVLPSGGEVPVREGQTFHVFVTDKS